MKTLFDEDVLKEIVNRICSISPVAERQWGKMDSAQMFAHCSATLSMAAGQNTIPRYVLGRLIGPLLKRSFVGERPFRKNGPTAKELVVADERDFASERAKLLDLVRAFSTGGEAHCTHEPHPFFGQLLPAEWGRVMYKHLDHHLRQFGG